MLGFWRDGVLTDGPRDGRLRTGDLGWIDDAGYLHITDRKSLLIIRGGANVYPAEVERVLMALPGVGACAVVGLPDPRLGQRVAAVVQRAADRHVDEATILTHCRAQLAGYKVPERIAFVDGFTRNAMGKIDRTTLGDVFGGSPGE
jgi:acyl-CoA synthetase (AMP-forming)/AMP-acid ligase II